MTVLGYWVIIAGFIASVVAALAYYRVVKDPKKSLSSARLWLKISVWGVILASIFLLTLLLRHDFTNGYVFSYSSRSLPIHFLISSFYAGQEGSFLFWTLCSALIALMLVKYTSKRKSEPWVMAVFMAVQSFLLLLLIVKSPFRYLWEMFPDAPIGTVPSDGRGLNPLLQNFWMVIHPPVLFIGFAAMAVPFSFALGGLWKKHYMILSERAFPWVLFTSAVLGLGIMLGAYWAYGVLGWGGYWGWDPVENSSLIPWITSVALIHTLLAQRRSMKFVKTNFFLAIISFFLVVYSTFLTRSGILGDSSVHSFTDPGASVYWLLVAFLALIAFGGFGMLFMRWKELTVDNSETKVLSREWALGTGTVALLLSAAVVLFGTSLPIFSKSSVEPSFYDTTNLPIAIALALLIGFGLLVQWHIDEGKEILRRSIKPVAASLVASAVLYYFGVREMLILLFAFTSLFALLVNIELGVKIVKVNPRLLGGKLAHIGLALFFLGVISTGKFSTSEHVPLPLNAPKQALGYTLTYTGHEPTPDGKYAFNIEVEGNGRKFQLSPVMFNAGEHGTMRNPDIKSFLTDDFYISPTSIEESTENIAGDVEQYVIPKGGTVSMGDVNARFIKFDMGNHSADAMINDGDGWTIGSVLELSRGSSRETVTPVAVYQKNGSPFYRPSKSQLVNATIQLVSMDVGMGSTPSTVTVEVQRSGSGTGSVETLMVEVNTKPFIGLLWSGTVVMMVGFVFSIMRRPKEL